MDPDSEFDEGFGAIPEPETPTQALFGKPRGTTDKGEVRTTRIATAHEAPGNGLGLIQAGTVYTLAGILRQAQPLSPQENHSRLLYLARGVKTLEQQEGREWPPTEQRARAVRPWVEANPHREPGKSVDQYFLEFLECHRDAKYRLDANALDRAWESAEACTAVPAVAAQVEDPQLRQLILWCRELQRLAGAHPFFLACRSVQERFGLSHPMTARTWLRGLETLGILQEAEPGVPGRRKATRWRYLHPLDA